MSDPRRLIDEDDLARLLLSSASEDEPSAEGRARARRAALSATAVGLGVGASVSLVAGGAKAAGNVSSSILLKWVVLASLPVAVVTGVVVTQIDSPQPQPQPAVAVPPPAPPISTVPSHFASAKVPAPSVDPPVNAAEDTPAEPRSPSSRKPAAATAPGAGAPSLQAEITRFDAARHALARGDASVLDGYLSEYPRGALREQALWMKISFLQQTGRKAEARALAKRLVASYPKGAFADRARALAVP